MGWRENKNGKRTFIYFCGIGVGLLAVILLMNFISYRNYCKRVNQGLYSILREVKEYYPQVPEEKLVEILNGQGEEDKTKISYLKEYGIDLQRDSLLEPMKKELWYSSLYVTAAVLLFLLLCIFTFFSYLKKQDGVYQEIIHYINEINQNNYDLRMEENEEGGISRLKNELYKITVMLREQADNSSKEKEALKDAVADLSHQLKTPLTSMAIMIENLRENEDMDETSKIKFLQNLSRQTEWMNQLVITMLKLARFDAGVVGYQKEKIILKDLFVEVIETLSIAIEVKEIQITIEGQEEVVIVGDVKWEREAMTNILKNAIEHTREKGKIRILLEENSFFKKLKIMDNGIGMDKEDAKHVFDRFYKGKNSSEHSIGIGLALAKKIIEQDNGTIKVQSEPEKGTCFEIRYNSI